MDGMGEYIIVQFSGVLLVIALMNLRVAIKVFQLAMLLQMLGYLLTTSLEFVGLLSLERMLLDLIFSFYLPAFWLFHLIAPPPTLPDIIYGFAAILFSILFYSIMVALIIGLLVGQLRRKTKKGLKILN